MKLTLTEKALLERGIDSKKIEILLLNNLTINEIKNTPDDILINLGLTEYDIKKIKDGKRPPIPESTLNKLLYETNATCCICKNSENGIVIHHIKEWHISKSHDIENLIVLCPNCHSKVHAKSTLLHNFTDDEVRNFKKTWIEEVSMKTAKRLSELQEKSGIKWDYINIKRLLENAYNNGITGGDERYITYLQERKILTKELLLNSYEEWLVSNKTMDCIFHSMEGNYLYFYLESILHRLISEQKIIDLKDIWEKNEILDNVRTGDYITYTGKCYFKSGKIMEGENQSRLFYIKNKNIIINSELNAFYATSTSARNLHLTGQKSSTVIGIVTSIIQTVLGVDITVSTLCIGLNIENQALMRTIF